jgi:hypothetical protein
MNISVRIAELQKEQLPSKSITDLEDDNLCKPPSGFCCSGKVKVKLVILSYVGHFECVLLNGLFCN